MWWDQQNSTSCKATKHIRAHHNTIMNIPENVGGELTSQWWLDQRSGKICQAQWHKRIMKQQKHFRTHPSTTTSTPEKVGTDWTGQEWLQKDLKKDLSGWDTQQHSSSDKTHSYTPQHHRKHTWKRWEWLNSPVMTWVGMWKRSVNISNTTEHSKWKNTFVHTTTLSETYLKRLGVRKQPSSELTWLKKRSVRDECTNRTGKEKEQIRTQQDTIKGIPEQMGCEQTAQ